MTKAGCFASEKRVTYTVESWVKQKVAVEGRRVIEGMRYRGEYSCQMELACTRVKDKGGHRKAGV